MINLNLHINHIYWMGASFEWNPGPAVFNECKISALVAFIFLQLRRFSWSWKRSVVGFFLGLSISSARGFPQSRENVRLSKFGRGLVWPTNGGEQNRNVSLIKPWSHLWNTKCLVLPTEFVASCEREILCEEAETNLGHRFTKEHNWVHSTVVF